MRPVRSAATRRRPTLSDRDSTSAGLYRLAKHVAEGAPGGEALVDRAKKVMEAVEALAKAHAAALDAKPGSPFEKKAWVGHLPIFLRSFMDVPARESYTMAVVDPDERSAAAGVTGIGTPPTSASRALIFASARPALISLLSLSITSAGVPTGAPTPGGSPVTLLK